MGNKLFGTDGVRGDGCRQAGLYREQKGGDSQRHQNFRGYAGGGNDCRFYFSGS